MRTIIAIICLLTACTALHADPPCLVGETTASVGETSFVDVTGEPAFDPKKPISENLTTFSKWVTITKVVCSSPAGPDPDIEPDVSIKFSFKETSLAWDMRIKFTPHTNGVYVIAVAVNSEMLLHRVEVGPVVPPPDPEPKPQTAPWAAPGLTVMILRESQNLATLPTSQRAIFTSDRIHKWLKANAVKLTDGQSGYRVLDDDSGDVSGLPDVLQKAFAVVKAKSDGDKPIIGISNGKAGFVGPLPASIDETIKLLEAYK